MGFSNIRDLSLQFFAISSGDCRIKIDKAIQNKGPRFLHDHQMDESKDEFFYGDEDKESQNSSGDDDYVFSSKKGFICWACAFVSGFKDRLDADISMNLLPNY